MKNRTSTGQLGFTDIFNRDGPALMVHHGGRLLPVEALPEAGDRPDDAADAAAWAAGALARRAGEARG